MGHQSPLGTQYALSSLLDHLRRHIHTGDVHTLFVIGSSNFEVPLQKHSFRGQNVNIFTYWSTSCFSTLGRTITISLDLSSGMFPFFPHTVQFQPTCLWEVSHPSQCRPISHDLSMGGFPSFPKSCHTKFPKSANCKRFIPTLRKQLVDKDLKKHIYIYIRSVL